MDINIVIPTPKKGNDTCFLHNGGTARPTHGNGGNHSSTLGILEILINL